MRMSDDQMKTDLNDHFPPPPQSSHHQQMSIPIPTALYDTLGIDRHATAQQIRKAFLKLSLRHHPDRNPGDAAAAAKFQEVYRAYSTLSEPEKRRRYDRTGEVDEGDGDLDDGILSAQLTEEDIREFEREYKGSKEEEIDLLEIYKQFEGDMDQVMINVILAENEDEPRFTELINKHISSGDVPAYPMFVNDKGRERRMKAAQKEAGEAEEHAKALGIGDLGNLEGVIMARHAQRGGFLADLEAKYAKPKKSRKRKKKT